jgi:hypothetical protein
MERLKDNAAVSDLGLRRIKTWGRTKTWDGIKTWDGTKNWAAMGRPCGDSAPTVTC